MSFLVVQEGDYFSLEYRGNRFASLSKQLCSTLCQLFGAVRIQAHVAGSDLMCALSSWRATNSGDFALELNIYSSVEKAVKVGKILSKCGLFLQQPRYGMNGGEYYNPHILRLEGYTEPVISDRVFDPSRGDMVETPDRGVEEEPENSDSVVVNSILDSLSHHVVLREIPIDRRVKTVLLP